MDFIEGLKEERASLKRTLDAIDVLLESYDIKDTTGANVKDNHFPIKGSNIDQITYVIKNANRFLHNNEITNELSKYSNKDSSLIKRRVSAVLSKAKREGGNLTSITVGASKRNSFWGSKEWLDSKDVPLNQHMYNKDLLVVKTDKKINI